MAAPWHEQTRRQRLGQRGRRLRFESCEDRRLLSVGVGLAFPTPDNGLLTLVGSAGDDQVTVVARNSYVDIFVGGRFQTRLEAANAGNISAIEFNGQGGADSLTIQGLAGTGPGPGYSVELTDVETLAVIHGTHVRVGSNGPLNLDSTSIWGTLAFDQGIHGPFALTQTGPLVVDGITTLDVGAASAVTLTDPANDFSTLVVPSVGDLSLEDANAIVFGATSVSGDLTVRAGLDATRRVAVSQSGKLTVQGQTRLTVGPESTILLSRRSGTPLNPDNALVGTVSATAAHATIYNGLATHLGSSNVAGNLSIWSAGGIDQSGGGPVVVGKAATMDAFKANASLPAAYYSVTLDNPGNSFGTLTVPRAEDVTIHYARPLNLGRCTLIASGAGTGNLDIATEGDITQSGPLVVAGYARLNAGAANDITLANPENNFSSGPSADNGIGVGIDSGRNVTLRDANAVTLRDSTVSGTLAVTAGGEINQNGRLTVAAGETTLSAGRASITLDNPGNDFREVTASAGNTVRLHDAGDLKLGSWRIAGNLTLTADGDLTQSAESAVVVGGTATFVLSGNDATLDNPANDFNRVVIQSGRNVSLQDVSAIVFGSSTSTVSGDLTVRANLNPSGRVAIAQSGRLIVGGQTTLAAGPASTITLNHQSGAPANPDNELSGIVSVTAGANAVIYNKLATHLGTSRVTGNLWIRAADAIDQSGGGPLVVGKLATVQAMKTGPGTPPAATDYDVTLDNDRNDLCMLTVPRARNLSVVDATSLILGPCTVAWSGHGTGNLQVTTNGPVAQAGALKVGARASFSAGAAHDIVFTNPGNDFVWLDVLDADGQSGARNVTLRDANDLDLGHLIVSGRLSAITNGSIGQNAQIQVAGLTTLAAGKTNNITLDDAGNRFSELAVTSGNHVRLANSNALRLGRSTISGDLGVTVADGGVTQSDAIVVRGTTSLEAKGQDIELIHDGNDFARLAVKAGHHVCIHDVNSIELCDFGSTAAIAGDVNVTAGAGITQAASTSLQVTGTTTIATSERADITLDQANNRFVGPVGVASGRNVLIEAVDGLTLDTSNVSGRLSLITTGAGDIAQTGAGLVAASLTLDAGAITNNIDFTNDANSFGKVSVVQGNNVALRTRSSLVLATLTVGGDLSVDSGGTITDTGLITVTGNTTILASQNVRLDTAGSMYGTGTDKWLSLTGGDLYVKNASATLLGQCLATGDLTVVAAGALTNSPDSGGTIYTLTVEGTATLYAGSNALALYTAGSTFGTLVPVGSPVDIIHF